jgi:hypothetical protein
MTNNSLDGITTPAAPGAQADDTTPKANADISQLENELGNSSLTVEYASRMENKIRDNNIKIGAVVTAAVLGFTTWAATTYFAVSCLPPDQINTPEKLIPTCGVVGFLALRSLCFSVPGGAGIGAAGGYAYYLIAKRLHRNYDSGEK